MTSYRVSFLNEITNEYGRERKVCRRSIVIRSARTPERAIEAAKRRFARLEGVSDWCLRAHEVEWEAIDPPIAIARPVRRELPTPGEVS
jgi:hypothetical protein